MRRAGWPADRWSGWSGWSLVTNRPPARMVRVRGWGWEWPVVRRLPLESDGGAELGRWVWVGGPGGALERRVVGS